MPNVLDVLVVVACAAIWPLWSHFVAWPRHVQAVRAGDPKARTRVYQRTVLEQWGLTAAAVAVMTAHLARTAERLRHHDHIARRTGNSTGGTTARQR